MQIINVSYNFLISIRERIVKKKLIKIEVLYKIK